MQGEEEQASIIEKGRDEYKREREKNSKGDGRIEKEREYRAKCSRVRTLIGEEIEFCYKMEM